MTRMRVWALALVALSAAWIGQARAATTPGRDAPPKKEHGIARARASLPSWAGARLVSEHANDWEPAIAADPSRPFVYVLVTRIDGRPACSRNCPVPPIMLSVSKDGGRSFGRARYLCACHGVGEMFDPQIEVVGDGTVLAAWMNDYHVVFARSRDHGRTWSEPVPVYLPRRWSDKPILAADPGGEDVYIAFNGPSAGDSYVAQSHDGGQSWQKPVKVVDSNRYFFAGGGQVLPDGTVVFSEASETQNAAGSVRIHAIVSSDHGATWRDVMIDEVPPPPSCTSDGCYDSFYGAGSALAADGAGNLVLAYQRGTTGGSAQRMYVRRSSDGGLTWTRARAISPRGVVAAFPAAVAIGDDDVRIWYMDDRRGPQAWNVWYRSSEDAGRTWSRALRISEGASGPAREAPNGFASPYGDYGEIDVTSRGRSVAVWGAGASYAGPGGCWFNRSKKSSTD